MIKRYARKEVSREMLALARWRDVAVVLLALETFVWVLAWGVVLYLARRGVLRFQEWLRPYLTLAGGYTRQTQMVVERVAGTICAPFVWLGSAMAGLHRALEILSGR